MNKLATLLALSLTANAAADKIITSMEFLFMGDESHIERKYERPVDPVGKTIEQYTPRELPSRPLKNNDLPHHGEAVYTKVEEFIDLDQFGIEALSDPARNAKGHGPRSIEPECMKFVEYNPVVVEDFSPLSNRADTVQEMELIYTLWKAAE